MAKTLARDAQGAAGLHVLRHDYSVPHGKVSIFIAAHIIGATGSGGAPVGVHI
jgi:hypothetical protein